MNITCDITNGMNPAEKEIYFRHMEMRHREEQQKLDEERVRMAAYKNQLIADILKLTKRFEREDLKKLSIRTLERIYDFA